MLRFVPPAGTPLKMIEVFGSLRTATSSNGHVRSGLATLSEFFHVQHVFGVSSGRAALWLILRSLQRLAPERDVVAVPAYTCFSVPAAVVRAKLRLHPVEITPKTFDLEMAQLEEIPSERLLCVLTANLFGLVGDTARIRTI